MFHDTGGLGKFFVAFVPEDATDVEERDAGVLVVGHGEMVEIDSLAAFKEGDLRWGAYAAFLDEALIVAVEHEEMVCETESEAIERAGQTGDGCIVDEDEAQSGHHGCAMATDEACCDGAVDVGLDGVGEHVVRPFAAEDAQHAAHEA